MSHELLTFADGGVGCTCTMPVIIGVVIAVVGVTVGISGKPLQY